MDTIFDKILRKEIPCAVVFENDHVLAFKDINPQAPVHVLVIPKKKVMSFAAFHEEKDPLWIATYMQNISLVAKQLGLEENGYRVVFNTKDDGGQTVPYIHAHILGGRSMEWPPG